MSDSQTCGEKVPEKIPYEHTQILFSSLSYNIHD